MNAVHGMAASAAADVDTLHLPQSPYVAPRTSETAPLAAMSISMIAMGTGGEPNTKMNRAVMSKKRDDIKNKRLASFRPNCSFSARTSKKYFSGLEAQRTFSFQSAWSKLKRMASLQ